MAGTADGGEAIVTAGPAMMTTSTMVGILTARLHSDSRSLPSPSMTTMMTIIGEDTGVSTDGDITVTANGDTTVITSGKRSTGSAPVFAVGSQNWLLINLQSGWVSAAFSFNDSPPVADSPAALLPWAIATIADNF